MPKWEDLHQMAKNSWIAATKNNPQIMNSETQPEATAPESQPNQQPYSKVLGPIIAAEDQIRHLLAAIAKDGDCYSARKVSDMWNDLQNLRIREIGKTEIQFQDYGFTFVEQ
jgi:hypothetical protein